MTESLRSADTLTRIAEAQRLGYWPYDWPLPSVLNDVVLRLVLGIAESTFYRLKKLHRFRPLEVQIDLVRGTRYSGSLVDQFRKGQWTHARSFGRKVS